MSTVESLHKDVQLILDSNRAYIEKSSELPWQPSDGFFPLILRTILRRQFDSLEVILSLVDQGRGFAAGPALRPSCEELIWTKYLLSMPRPTAEKLILSMAVRETHERLSAQFKAAGREGIENLGLTPYLDRSERQRRNRNKESRDIGTLLKWPESTIKGAALPSMAWIAKEVGEQQTYDLVYAATSRFVHFSPGELSRWAWYQNGSASISSTTFEPYWSHFCLYWGLRLFLETAVLIYDHPTMPDDSMIDSPTIIAAAKRIAEIGIPPVVTAEELETPFSWPLLRALSALP